MCLQPASGTGNDEPSVEWRCEMQGRYHRGDWDALDLLMGLPRVEITLAREAEKHHLGGDEQNVRDRARRALIKSHQVYEPSRDFEPWANPHIRSAAREQKRWRKRPRNIWKALSNEATTMELDRLITDFMLDFRPVLASLKVEEIKLMEQCLQGLPINKIASNMGMDVGQTYRLYYRVLEVIRKKLKDNDGKSH